MISSISSNTYSKRTFTGKDKPENQRQTVPINDADSFERVNNQPDKPSSLGKLAGKLFKKAKEVGQKAVDKVSKIDVQQGVNIAKITKMMVENKTFSSYKQAYEYKEEIAELAKLDFKEVEKKYMTIANNYKKEESANYIHHGIYLTNMMFWRMNSILSYEKLTVEDINELFKIRHERPNVENGSKLDIYGIIATMKQYENYENLSARKQKEMIDKFSLTYDIDHESTLSKKEAEKISDYSLLMKYDYIRDLKNTESNEAFLQNLDERRKNIPCKAIETDKELLKKVTSEKGIEDIKKALNETNLEKYKAGFELEYSRTDFIADFNKITKGLSPKDKKAINEHFQFKIDSSNDIVNYPNPQLNGEISPALSETVEKCQECVNKFMFKNCVRLEPEDKDLEKVLNNIIKAYPEFLSVIGKKQHRGDSIDYHTFDDMKRIMKDPEFEELTSQEKRILTVATLFHDYGKSQGTIDDEHALKSAQSAKEIIKKMEVSFDEKERIYNLIKHSHWLVDGSSNEDIAFYFRRPNDFKMAQIFEKADSNSAGFEYSPNSEKIDSIKKNIDKINSNGIPIFANSLPTDIAKYDVNINGVRYLDFRDPEASVEKYGYPKGTKVKDLKFLCHASDDGEKDFSILCDDSKDVCLSTMLLDKTSNFQTGYNGMGAYILSGNNANIIIAGKELSCTGGHRGYYYAKESMFQRMENLSGEYGGYLNRNAFREEIPNQIREALKLNKDEYIELYNSICNLKQLEDIDDIKLSTGRVINAEDIKTTISEIRDFLVQRKEVGANGYTNEVVIYNPKIEACVVSGDIDRYKNSSVPLVLV